MPAARAKYCLICGNSTKDSCVTFYSIPGVQSKANSEQQSAKCTALTVRFQAWKNRIGHLVIGSLRQSHYVCAKHFVSGKPSLVHNSQDYVPDISGKDVRLPKHNQVVGEAAKTIAALESKIKKLTPCRFSPAIIRDSDSKTLYYTNLPNYATYEQFVHWLKPFISSVKPYRNGSSGKRRPNRRKLSVEEEIFVTLVWLRLGLQLKQLADNLGVTVSCMSKILHRTLHIMRFKLEQAFYRHTPEVTDVAHVNPRFLKYFPDCTMMIDCFETRVEQASDLGVRKQLFSTYKNYPSLKLYVMITGAGYVTKVSNVWGGRATDRFITRNDDLPGYVREKTKAASVSLMADRGFAMKQDFSDKGVNLIMPSSKERGVPMSPNQLEYSQAVERVIKLVRTFRILSRVQPLSMHYMFDPIFTVCALMVNFMSPAIKPANRSQFLVDQPGDSSQTPVDPNNAVEHPQRSSQQSESGGHVSDGDPDIEVSEPIFAAGPSKEFQCNLSWRNNNDSSGSDEF